MAIILALAGGLLTEVGPWYRGLRKSRLNPPDWAFGPVWFVILSLAAAAGVLAWEAAPDSEARGRVLILFGVNWVCHLLWSPLFFKLKRPDWAFFEMFFLWGSILALIIGLAPISVTASLLIVPYLAWVSVAAWLNFAILRLNPSFRRG